MDTGGGGGYFPTIVNSVSWDKVNGNGQVFLMLFFLRTNDPSVVLVAGGGGGRPHRCVWCSHLKLHDVAIVIHTALVFMWEATMMSDGCPVPAGVGDGCNTQSGKGI